MEHLQMIEGSLIEWRIAPCSSRDGPLEVFLKGEASPAYLFVPALPVVAFWLLDAWYLKREPLFRQLFDDVRKKDGPADFSMDVATFKILSHRCP